MRKPARRMWEMAIASLWLCTSCGVGWAKAMPHPLLEQWGITVGGAVTAIDTNGEAVFLGGSFSSIGPNRGGAILCDNATGAPIERSAKVAGTIYAAVSDNAGGWFLGGDFCGVDGSPQANVAHLDARGRLLPWNPEVDGAVRALVVSGSTVYLGGMFGNVGGQGRLGLAAVDRCSGAVLPWNPETNEGVLALCKVKHTLFVGGRFTSVGHSDRAYAAAIDLRTGDVTDWDPQASYWVRTLALADTTIILGGDFHAVRGEPREHLAACDLREGRPTEWQPRIRTILSPPRDLPAYVASVKVSGRRIYVAGHFLRVDDAIRGGLASFDLSSSRLMDWNPNNVSGDEVFAPYIEACAIDGDRAYVGGYFYSMGGVARTAAAAVDVSSGSVSAWKPNPNGAVLALDAAAGRVCVGGSFTSAWNWERRSNLAAFDAKRGQPLPWNPEVDLPVYALRVHEGKVYIGGSFARVNGLERPGLAAVNARSGQVTPWNPGVDGPVYTLQVDAQSVYVGGWFEVVGGAPRRNLAAVNRSTGSALAWNPSPEHLVKALAVSGRSVYVGGFFEAIGGMPRRRLAEVDRETGLPTAWDPHGDGVVLALAVSDAVVYAGGAFGTMGGTPRNCLAAIDRRSGSVTTWDARLTGTFGTSDSRVVSLALAGDVLFIGGFFDSVGTRARGRLAAVSTVTAQALDWDSGIDGVPWALHTVGERLHVGGVFRRFENWPRSGFVTTDWRLPAVARGPKVSPQRMMLGPSTPNPARQTTTVSVPIWLADERRVVLQLYDVLGRRIGGPAYSGVLPAGGHTLFIDLRNSPSGWYFYRLESSGMALGRSLIITR